MKKSVVNVLVFGALVAVGFSCSNAEMEGRLARLEGRVAELEAGKARSGPASTAATASPTIQQTALEEEVPSGPAPVFTWAEETHDFGTITEGEIAEHVFKFTNTGEAPLIISNASASCGCTVPVWPKEPIPVGGTGEIQVKFNSSNKPGVQNKTVSITANTAPKLSRLNIKAVVAPKTGAADGPVKK
ncbi:MAG: DUF1573 domain-containing protein [Imperialibacter sp.]|uniref:DUF1573 domain-containing protein n=1 Tax=Imperialibacter sp. TaxID=2038411 RepID=UPI0032EADD66